MMAYPIAPLRRSVTTPRWTVLLFALGVLAIAMIPSTLTFALDPNAATRIGVNEVPIEPWMFTVVWNIAYPCMGIATWLVWRRRGEVEVSVPLVIFAVALLQTMSFWLTNSLRMTAVMDATGVVLAYAVAWVYSRYVKSAVWWLLPWLLWMPTTLVIKLWALLD
jgi:benzodiazapine receptor